MRKASPASTVPMSQRWTSAQNGRRVSKAATAAADSTMSAFTLRLMVICVAPSSTVWPRMAPACASTNCGSSER